MTTAFERHPGGLSAALSEPDWRALAGAADQLPAALRPMPARPGEPSPAELVEAPAPELSQAVGLLTSPQPFRAVVSATVADGSGYGLLAAIAADVVAGAAVIRALVPSRTVPEPIGDGPVTVPESVQLRAFTPDRLVAETLRLFPPDPPRIDLTGPRDEDRRDAPVVSMAVTDARALARAVAEDDAALLAGVAELNGWDEVPPLLISLAEQVRATVTLSLQRVGRPTLHATWLQCELGWAHTSVRGGRVRHQLRSRSQIGNDLVAVYAGAYTAAARAARSA